MMNNRKIVELLLSVQMDDLNDAEMLAHYASKIHEAGDTEIARAMASRAKARLTQMGDCKRTIDIVMQRIAAEGDGTEEGMYKELLEDFVDKRAEKVRGMLDSM